MRRNFSTWQRRIIALKAGNLCQRCGKPLSKIFMLIMLFPTQRAERQL